MKKKYLHFILYTAIISFSLKISAKENVNGNERVPVTTDQTHAVMSGCLPATDKADLDINNVRTTILTGGDMWWDLLNGKYFVPKPAKGAVGTTALFAGSLWIGGEDVGGSLKVAAMTYRQTGNDFWPGPLDPTTGDITAGDCSIWDKHYTVNRADVEAYYYWAQTDRSTPNPISKEAMDVIANWPTVGPGNRPLAPFWDRNGNGVYNYDDGEVPDFDIDGTRGCSAQLFGDQSMFWVFNDKGNIHSETKGTAIGLEIQAQGFAFKTNDEINNMTFYRYKIINRSSSILYNTYFGVWCDPDLGSGTDDYVGCDVELGLGFCYNGDLVDDNPFPGQIPYGANPPAIGIDFFEGPYADSNGVDDAALKVPSSFLNYGNGIVDDERIGMAKFVYYNNDFTNTGNPTGGNLPGATNIYNYLKGIWLDGSPITYGGNGYKTGIPCNYMFPGSSDPKGFGTNMIPQNPWDEASVGNIPADRRFIESAGPFTLKSGAVNTITIGVVWARTTQGGNLASVALMKGADSKAQKLFDRCFKTLDGPSAPILSIQELENQLILSWNNPKGSNNYKEGYKEDPNISSSADSAYRFEGYKVYQLKDATVSAADLFNVDKARLVFQCDIANNTSQIVNYTPDLGLSALVPKEMVNGANKGIMHSLIITDDKFAIGNTKLVNHKTYYYTIIAYAYSPRPNTTPFNPAVLEAYEPYLAGRLSADRNAAFAHSAIPHTPSPEENGTSMQSGYGSGPKLTRIEGHGNGGNILDIADHTTDEILASPDNIVLNPEYLNDRGPVEIKVVDPLNVADGNYRFLLSGDNGNARWKLVNLSTNETVFSDSTLRIPNEQIINGQPSGDSKTVIPKWGLSVNVAAISYPGSSLSQNGGFLDASITFADPSKKWLTGVADQEGMTNTNWIRSGSVTFPGNDAVFSDFTGVDDLQSYEKILGGTWAPYRLCSNSGNPSVRGGPAWSSFQDASLMKNLASVDVMITSDKTKWTRCPVLELEEESALAAGNVAKLNLRSGASVDKNGNANFPSADNDDFATGMGWFPGYAINIETGERLNMAFGEDSFLKGDNGNDMIWNPTSTFLNPNTTSLYGEPIFGGKHYIYIFGHNGDVKYPGGDPYVANKPKSTPRYDKGRATHDMLDASVKAGSLGIQYKRDAYSDAMWVNIPLLAANSKLLDNDVKIRLRVAKPYRKGFAADTLSTDMAVNPINSNYPAYEFNTSDLKTIKNDIEVAKTSLDLINIVPNPYYAYSGYEKAAVDNIVKITNLPRECSINIYTLNGTLIRKFKKADESASLDWDLKNQALIPIASGMYIIHISVPNVGEKVLKWFGVMRPIDLDAY